MRLPNDAASVLACTLLLAMTSAGCSGRNSLYPIEGVLTIDGKPVPQGVQVRFSPENADRDPCIGVTNDKGQYVMYFRPGMKGLPKGNYVVSVTSPSDGVSGPVILPPELAGITIPERYRAGKSDLRCTVPTRGNTLDIAVETH